ncbi:MAG: DUF3143 domain-containing protein [Cyanobacteriota bacterium]|nr:DUF3143 domain-containing protein [Cyanobacteriota bacterium]
MSDVAGEGAGGLALPPLQTPLYNHPLPLLEAWLTHLGARQRGAHSTQWDLHQPQWSALLELEVEELKVSWLQDGRQSVRHFPYGLSRADVEAAILAGP